MTTGKFFKKYATVCAVAFTVFITGYAAFLSFATKISLEQELCFVAMGAESVETCVLDVTKNGGAGYLLDDGKDTLVALSVYFSKENAESVWVKNKDYYDDLQTLSKPCDTLYLKTRAQKRNGEKIKTDFETVYESAVYLSDVVLSLDNGATQESVKRTANALREKLEIFAQICVTPLKEPCEQAATGLKDATKGIVTSANLRYVLCQLCDGYARATASYCL